MIWASVALATCGDEPLLGELLCTDTVEGDLLSGAHELDSRYACGEPYAGLFQLGPEDVYTWVCPDAGAVSVVVSDMVCDLDLYLLDGTCDAELGCLSGDTRSDLDRVEASATCLAPGDLLHVVVEGYGLAVPTGDCLRPDAGTYTLVFDLVPGGCERLEPQLPVPGEPGAINHFEIVGGTPGESVQLVLSMGPGSTPVPGCPGLEVSGAVRTVLGQDTASVDGIAAFERLIPSVAEGRSTLLSAVERSTCRVSDPVPFSW